MALYLVLVPQIVAQIHCFRTSHRWPSESQSVSSGVAARLADDIAGLARAPIVAERATARSTTYIILSHMKGFSLRFYLKPNPYLVPVNRSPFVHRIRALRNKSDSYLGGLLSALTVGP